MVYIIKSIYIILNASERRRAAGLMFMVLIMAFLDVLGIASIFPFMAVLSNPDFVNSNDIINKVFEISREIGVENQDQFLFILGILVFLCVVGSLGFKALTNYVQIRVALMYEYSIGKRLIDGYLQQPFSWFLNRHSADLGSTILSEVETVIHKSVIPLMTLISQGAVTVGVLVLLVLVDPFLALGVGVLFGISYIIIVILSGSVLKRLGQLRHESNRERFAAVSEAFNAIKEVKAGGLEDVYVRRFAKPAETYAQAQATAQVIAHTPRYAIEAIASGGMVLVILYLMKTSGSFDVVLPVVALYAFAGIRIMPALHQAYGAITQLRFSAPALHALHQNFNQLQLAISFTNADNAPLELTNSIDMKQVSYSYPNASRPALNNITLQIPAKSTVAFVGTTGSGKTSAVDVLLGLLEPCSGSLTVDGLSINNKNLKQWRRNIGYVPQNIYLSDDTISANIAFGVDKKDVDFHAVERAAKIAMLHDFISDDLPQGYKTVVGERGVRLSGGQRQRIGIARALYFKPQVLILDEATSALDTLTEKAVVGAIQNLGENITIILIAHRLSTVRQCDQIYLLENGSLIATGTYQELQQNNEKFNKMTKGV